MLIDRPQVVEGSSIQNATVPSGTAFPLSPNIGELFFLTSGAVGLYTYSGAVWDVSVKGTELAAHLADDTRHLTLAQNTLLDNISVDAATINTIPAVTSRVSAVETNLTNHIADDARHLTTVQNSFIDGLNLPTLTSAAVNFVAGTTSNVQSQINAVVAENNSQNTSISNLQTAQSGQNTTSANLQAELDAHEADNTRHLTAAQNTFLDGITVDFTQVNALTGLTTYLAAAGNTTLANQLSSLDNFKLNVSGSNAMTGSLNMGGQKIINLASPTLASDAVNKDYVDSFVQGLHWVGSTRVATVQNGALSGLQTIDGITLATGDRVLVKNQSATEQNGIWIAASGAWSRANDFNTSQEINNSAVFVLEGTSQGKSTWIQLSTVTALNTDPITWSAFSGPVINSAGPGIALGTGGMVSLVQGYGLTFDGNALITDLMPNGGLMHTQDNATASVAPGAQLSLTNIGTSGTYRSVTTDAKGRVTAGTNPTTIAGYGLTDALNKNGDSMLGPLSFVGGTAIYTTAPTPGNTWFTTAPYGTGQGDNRTHFGYNASGVLVNHIRGVSTFIPGNLTVDGAATYNGTAAFNSTATVLGSTIWTQGNLFNVSQLTNNAGYITAAGVTWTNLTGKPVRSTWASTESLPVVVGQLAWRNYSNNHTIFDASAGLTPVGSACSNVTPDNVWSATYPTLMGFNGASTYGVRVDSARLADSATTLSTLPSTRYIAKRRNRIHAADGTSLNTSITAAEYGFTYGGSGEPTGPFIAFGGIDTDINYSMQFVGGYDGGGNDFKVRTKNDDTINIWNPWRTLITDGNIASQSVNYANSAASATNATNAVNATLAAKASTLAQNGGNGVGMTFNWAGQGGQPPWLWGGSDGQNMYVYNPSNFSVAYATTAGTATSATNLTGFTIGPRSSADVNSYRTSGHYSLESTPANATNPYGSVIVASNSDVGLQISGGYSSDSLYFRGWYSSGATFTPWRAVIHSGNIAAQSVNYATSAGTATTAVSATTAGSAAQLTGPAYTNGTDGWFRSTGQAGWFNETYNVGIYATNAGIVRTYNNAQMTAAGFNGDAWGLTGVAPQLISGSTNDLTPNCTGTGRVWTAIQNFQTNKGASSYTGTNVGFFTSYTLAAYSADGGAAGMSFHRGGSYAINMGLDPDNVFRMGGFSAPANRFQMDMSGNLTMAGDVTAFSDERLKTNWRDVSPSFIEQWANVKHGVFERIDSGKTQIGLSAQAVQRVLPEAVNEMADGILTINYGAVSAVATVKLAEEVIELRKQLQMQGELIKLLMEKQGI